MPTTELPPLTVLYEQDETAWLEAMANLAADGPLYGHGFRQPERVSGGHGQTRSPRSRQPPGDAARASVEMAPSTGS